MGSDNAEATDMTVNKGDHFNFVELLKGKNPEFVKPGCCVVTGFNGNDSSYCFFLKNDNRML